MRCKKGDLAILVSPCQTEGLVVRVGALAAMESKHGPIWLVTGAEHKPGEWLHAGTPANGIDSCPDAWMKPIRDNDGEDEMLRIAGKPRELETQ
jgi:hypothetical protein